MTHYTHNPRQAALAVLLQTSRTHDHADTLIDRELTSGKLYGPDRSLFAELVLGALRRQATLDYTLSRFLDKPLSQLDAQALVILRLGLYQIVFLDRIPASAAVNESVNLAKTFAPRATGLINAVLRTYLRQGGEIPWPDRLTSPAAYLAARHSHPEWLAQQWIDQLGRDEAEDLAEASSSPAPLTIRINALRADRDEYARMLAEKGIIAEPCRFSPDGIRFEGRHRIIDLPGFSEGLFSVQDEASQLVSRLLDPQPGEAVLDTCAAPGGKATHMAELMNNRGEILACDLSVKKLALVDDNARRLGSTCIRCEAGHAARSGFQAGRIFDRVLVDAPCSGLGVIRRNPEIKWRITPEDLCRLATRQTALLANVAGLVRPGGILVYSTCSTSREENEVVIHEFLSVQGEFMIEHVRECSPLFGELCTSDGFFRAWPHRHGMDGFFAARLKRMTP